MKISAFILCQDIRAEISGTNTLVGVMNDGISFSRQDRDVWPKALDVSVFIRLTLSGDETPLDKFELNVCLGDNQLAQVASEIKIPRSTKLLNLPMIMKGIPVPAIGQLTFNFIAMAGDETLIKAEEALHVTIAEQPPSPE